MAVTVNVGRKTANGLWPVNVTFGDGISVSVKWNKGQETKARLKARVMALYTQQAAAETERSTVESELQNALP